MSNRKRLVVSILGVVIVLLISVVAITQIVQASPSSQPEKIAGSWITECTAVVQQKQFPVLFTFNTDGSLVGSNLSPGQSIGQGAWARGRNGEISYTSVVLMSDPQSADPTGTYVGRYVMTGTLQRDAGKDTWSGPFKIAVSDAAGQVFFNETGTIKLMQRIAVEPLN